jgi:hypothetical protein
MSVMGYIRRCTTCEVQMLVTVDYKHASLCTECMDETIADAIAAVFHDDDDDHLPPEQVTG